ncbi:unnamed protein product [Sphacelaria rigidula]
MQQPKRCLLYLCDLQWRTAQTNCIVSDRTPRLCMMRDVETDKEYAERQTIMAVLVEGQFVDFFLAPQTVEGGSNLICISIHRALTRLFDTHCSDGTLAYIDELYAQLDN